METIATDASIAYFLQKGLYYLLIALLVFNLLQRKHIKTGAKKRQATLYLAIVALVLMTAAVLIRHFNFSESLLLPVILAAVLLVLSKRSRFIPFRINCLKCGQRLAWQRFLYHDSNLCEQCEPCEPSESGESGEPGKPCEPCDNK
jgi:8-oxo-dGTP diphosphatase